MMTSPDLAPILSRDVVVETIPSSGMPLTITAEAQELTALAELNGIPAVLGLEANLMLRHEARGGVGVTGEVRGRVVQTCVVTLDDFESVVTESVEAHYLPEDKLEAYRSARKARAEADALEENMEDEPEVIVAGRIDVGVLVSEHLTLGLDPYPKKPGATFVEPASRETEPDASPFAALKSLKVDRT